jgi:exopolysaccharide biosynthesis polyprenyl glycosylphosphotransferase
MATTDDLMQSHPVRRDNTQPGTTMKFEQADAPVSHGASGPAIAVPAPAAVPHLRSPQLPSLRMRISERRLFLFIIDAFLLNLVLWLAAVLFADFPLSLDAILAYSKWFITLTVVWYVCAQFFDCYSLPRASSMGASVKSVTMAVIAAMVIYMLIPFLTPALGSRGMIFYLIAFSVGSVVMWRVVYAKVFAQPWFQQRALLVGAGLAGRALALAIHAAPTGDSNPYRGTGYQIVGFVDDDTTLRGQVVEGAPVLGDHQALVNLARTLKVDEIILAITHRHVIEDDLFNELLRCRELGYRVVTMASVYERLTGRVPIDHVGRDLEMVVPMDDNAGERAYQLFKRLMDFVIALLGVSLTLLLCIPIGLINARTSPGPLFYKQRRVGQGGKTIEVYKFRSMRPDAEKGTGAVWARKHDDRITPAGRFIRRFRLDEFPQFINVLKGEMSLIGPRPERPEFVNALALILPFYRARHAVKPGITGWAQINYGYGNSNEDSHIKLEYDLYYVKHASPLVDIKIILQTVPTMFLGKGL